MSDAVSYKDLGLVNSRELFKKAVDISNASTAWPLLAAIESISLRLGAAMTGL